MNDEEDEEGYVDEDFDARLENIVYDLLYYDWTPWSKCTRACKMRRFRICALRRWCKNTVLMEEKRCYVPDSECEKKYLQNENWHAEQVQLEISEGEQGPLGRPGK